MEKANQHLIEIIEVKNKLADLTYNDEQYDELEDKLHDLEDSFIDEHDESISDLLSDIYDEYCPEEEILSPISYIANRYIVDGKDYLVDIREGVFVEIEKKDYPVNSGRIVLLPNPLRFALITKEKIFDLA